MFNHEPIYDEKIAPLMAQIIGICTEQGIPFLATFQLTDQAHENEKESGEGPLYCTSVLQPEGCDEQLNKAVSVLLYHPRSALVMSVSKRSE